MKENNYLNILEYLPYELKHLFLKLDFKEITEIRLRTNRPIIIYTKTEEFFLSMKGSLSKSIYNAYIFTKENNRDFFRSRHIEIYYSFTVYLIPPRLEIRNLPLILWPPKRKKLKNWEI